MAPDKYSAVWVSHSSIGDFLKCPRAYYLKNVYKDPKTRRKITIVNAALSLGQAVHKTLEDLKNTPVGERLNRDLEADLETNWATVSGKSGGFRSAEEEFETKGRAKMMINRVTDHPGPLGRKTVRLRDTGSGMPPNFHLSEDENIILCGMIDWLEYVEADDSVRVIDFKTGKNEEQEDSLQLPIYLLLLEALQKRNVSGAAYWYLEYDDEPKAVSLPRLDEAREKVLAVARRVKAAREQEAFECPRGGCFACRPLEAILAGNAEYIGPTADKRQDRYMLKD